MADYRGVSKDDVISSLQRGEAFVRDLDLGPEIAEELDQWLAEDPYTKIAAAQDGKALADAMRETRSGGVFLRMYELFRFHATLDDDVYQTARDLSAWGAFSGGTHLSYTGGDAEIQSHLIAGYAREAKQGGVGRTVRLAFLAAAQSLSDKNAEMVKGAAHIIKFISSTPEDQLAQAVATLFAEAELGERYEIETLLKVMAGQDKAQDALALATPFQQYGIVFDEIPPKCNFGDMAVIIGDLPDQLHEILEPYFETDEADRIMMGAVTEKKPVKMGLSFRCTERAAKAVAAALPDHQIVDYEGNVIEPPAAPSANNSGPDTPQP